MPTTIGNSVTIGPGATIHAATIADCVVVGMGATIMDGAKVRPCFLVSSVALLCSVLGLCARGRCCRGCAALMPRGMPACGILPSVLHDTLPPRAPSTHTQVESRSVVAAGALVPPGTVVPSGQVWAGAPAKFIRNLANGERSC